MCSFYIKPIPVSSICSLFVERDMLGFLLGHLLPKFVFNVTVFNITWLLLSLKKSSLLSTRNIGHFVLFLLVLLDLVHSDFYHLYPFWLFLLWFPAIFCCCLTLKLTHFLVLKWLCWSFFSATINLVYLAFFILMPQSLN